MTKDGEGGGEKQGDGPRKVQLQVQVDDPVAQGVYSNGLIVNLNDSELTLDFLYVQPNRSHAKVRSRVIVSPRQAKRMARVLTENIRRYEKRFGSVPEVQGGSDPIIH